MTVFLAEDHDDNFFIVQSNLKKIDPSITLVREADGDKAIIRLSQDDLIPDLFLIDITMPHKDGLELIAWIKSRPEFRDIPTVALTASVFAEMKESYLEHGFDHILEKPFTRKDLAKLLQKVAG